LLHITYYGGKVFSSSVCISSNSVALTPLRQSTVSGALLQPMALIMAVQAGFALVSIRPELFCMAKEGVPDIMNVDLYRFSWGHRWESSIIAAPADCPATVT
jgi:hypothetical protein